MTPGENAMPCYQGCCAWVALKEPQDPCFNFTVFVGVTGGVGGVDGGIVVGVIRWW